MNERRQLDRWVPVVVVGIAIVFLFPLVCMPDGVAFYPGATYSDLAITHWPNAEVIRQSRQNFGQIPLWNPMILSGTPFTADPLSGLWYLPLWLAQLLPGVIAFNLLFALHLGSAGWGLYRFMRTEGGEAWPALIAAVAFMGCSKWAAHVSLGHVTLVFAVSWTPWLMLTVKRLCAEEIHWLRWSAAGGAVLGLIGISDPRWILPTGLLAAAYALVLSVRKKRSVSRTLMSGVVSVSMAAILSAPVSLPLLEFIPLSTRSALTVADQGTLALPVSGLFGLLFPITGQPEWSTYLGAAVLLLALLGLVNRIQRTWFWGIAAAISLLFALGDSFPLFGLMADLPGFDLLRVPPRVLFISSLSIAIMAGWGLHAVLEGVDGKKLVRSRLTAAAMAALLLFLGTALYLSVDQEYQGMIEMTALAGVLATVWAFISLSPRVHRTLIAGGWIVLVVFDLARVSTAQIEVRPASDMLVEKQAVVEFIHGEAMQRTFSPSYSIPQQVAADQDIQLADGVSPMQIQRYAEALSEAAGFPLTGYSVTLPPYQNGDPGRPAILDLDLQALGKLNIGWLIADYPLESDDLIFEEEIDGTWIYSNPFVRPRAWMEPVSGNGGEWQAVESLIWTPNHINILADGPGQLVLSEIDYPGWEIIVDGEKIEVSRSDSLFRTVNLPAGSHEVEFRFRPLRAWFGAGLSLLGLCCLAWLWRGR